MFLPKNTAETVTVSQLCRRVLPIQQGRFSTISCGVRPSNRRADAFNVPWH
jgi:hypothetical protein